MTFKTQQEIWLHLAQGGAVQHKDKPDFVSRFESGRLTQTWSFAKPSDWTPYVEPPRKVKRTFYRRKWGMCGPELFISGSFALSKELFDEIHLVGDPSRLTVWSDEWEEIVVEIPENLTIVPEETK